MLLSCRYLDVSNKRSSSQFIMALIFESLSAFVEYILFLTHRVLLLQSICYLFPPFTHRKAHKKTFYPPQLPLLWVDLTSSLNIKFYFLLLLFRRCFIIFEYIINRVKRIWTTKCWENRKCKLTRAYRAVLLKWEFFIKMRVAESWPSFDVEESWFFLL